MQSKRFGHASISKLGWIPVRLGQFFGCDPSGAQCVADQIGLKRPCLAVPFCYATLPVSCYFSIR